MGSFTMRPSPAHLEYVSALCYTHRVMAVRKRVRSHRSKCRPGEITLSQAADRLHCPVVRAESLVRSGRLLGRWTAHGWVTTEAAVQSYVSCATARVRPSSTGL